MQTEFVGDWLGGDEHRTLLSEAFHFILPHAIVVIFTISKYDGIVRKIMGYPNLNLKKFTPTTPKVPASPKI